MNNVKKKKFSISFDVIKTAVVILIALLIAFVIICVVSDDPITAFNKMFMGPFKSVRHFANVIEMMIPIMFTGLAISMMFKSRQFNLGVEGAFFIGAVGAVVVGTQLALPKVIHPIVAILVGGLIGGIVCTIPAILKVKWKANEVVSSLMCNYLCLFLGLFIVNNFLRDLKSGGMVSIPFAQTAALPKLFSTTRIHFGLIIIAILVVLVYLYLFKSKNGYELRMTGENENYARYTGINVSKVIILTQFLGGVLAGVGGSVEVLGLYTRFEWQALPGYGWDGVIVALLAKNNPAYVPLTAFFIAFIRIGADIMSRSTDVPNEVVSIIQGVIIVLIAAESFLSYVKKRRTFKEATENVEIA
ncbi:MAG: ABC transporter permease [Oscillospiraceae bacterium]